MNTRVRKFCAVGVAGEYWFVEYEYRPDDWLRLTLPFDSPKEAELWRLQYLPASPSDQHKPLVKPSDTPFKRA